MEDFDAGAAGQTALSGLETKPPALPKAFDYYSALISRREISTTQTNFRFARNVGLSGYLAGC